jgi:predicted aconitase
MKLTLEEERMLAGKCGAGLQRAMELLVAVGEAYDAPRMVDVACSHILSPEMQFWTIGKLSQWARELTAESVEGAQAFKVPVTINPIFLDPLIASRLGYPDAYMLELRETLSYGRETYARLGVIPTYTCCPFYSHLVRRGERVGTAESTVIIFDNSVIGATANRESGPTALATALTGKTPLYGMHLPENRHGQAVVKLKDTLDSRFFSYADYNALSYYTGKMVVDGIPVFEGLPENMTIAQLKYLTAPLGVSAGIAMFHAVGITPEAPTTDVALGGKKAQLVVEVGRQELDATYEDLCSAIERHVDYVLLGCPHVTIQEMREIAGGLQGRSISPDVVFILGTAEPLRGMAERMGLIAIIEDAGGIVVSGMCSAGTFLRRNVPPGFRVGVAATNSAKSAHYLKAAGVQVWFGTMKSCIEAAISGTWEDGQH